MRSALEQATKWGGLALLVALAVLLLVLPGGGEAHKGSTLSLEPEGLRALFLLCESLGFPVQPWSAAPGALSGRGALLFVPRVPAAPPSGPQPPRAESAPPRDENAPVAEDHGPTRVRDLGHYRRFVEEGGTLLLVAAETDTLLFARDALGVAASAVTSEQYTLADTPVRFPSGASVTLAAGQAWRFTGELPADARALAQADDGSILALGLPVGAGRVVLLGLPLDTFENRELERNDAAALFFVRLCESLAPFERVLFDEYALGGWTPEPLVALAFGPRLAWLSVHVLLLVAFVLWRAAWAGPFARDPEPLLALAPLARAQGLGRLFARAGRWDTLARLLQRGTLERWGARAGIRPPPALEGGRMEAGALAQNLDALVHGDERLLARVRGVFTRVPASESELEALGQELAALEGELFGHGQETTQETAQQSARRRGARRLPTRS